MAEADRILGMYLHLARVSQTRRRLMVRDKLLILAGVQAEEMGLAPISALCRHKILENNAHHLVRQWPDLATALTDQEFQAYLKQVRRRYSREKIEHMMHSLGIELGRERDAYFDDLEYAAALLDTRPEAIAAILAEQPRSSAALAQEDGPSTAADETLARARSDSRLRKMLYWWLVAIALVGYGLWRLFLAD